MKNKQGACLSLQLQQLIISGLLAYWKNADLIIWGREIQHFVQRGKNMGGSRVIFLSLIWEIFIEYILLSCVYGNYIHMYGFGRVGYKETE